MQELVPPTPPVPPIPLPAQATPAPQAVGVNVGQGPATSAEIYQAFRAQRQELRNQLESLEDKRSELSSRLQEEPGPTGADRAGLEARIKEVDARIINLEKEIATADASVARAASAPGATRQPPEPPRQGPPEEVFVIAGLFTVVVFLPLSIAFARRIWRRGAAVITQLPSELYDRFTRLEQAVDAIAVEVERVGEGQRFMSRVFADDAAQRALGAGAAAPIEMREREAAHLRRDR